MGDIAESDKQEEQDIARPGTGPVRKKYSEYSDEPITARAPTQSRSFQTLQGIVDPGYQGIVLVSNGSRPETFGNPSRIVSK